MIGNDVVDLAQADTRDGAQHPGFDRRVFDADERAAIAADGEPRRRRWMFWAAKEAAYKALRRSQPRFVFAPRSMHVALDQDGCGRVDTPGGPLAVRVAALDEAVSALATAPDTPIEAISEHALPARTPSDPPVDRDAIRAALGRALCQEAVLRGYPDAALLQRRGRIPSLRVGGKCFPVSISHHGRLARAAVLWQSGDPSRPRGVD